MFVPKSLFRSRRLPIGFLAFMGSLLILSSGVVSVEGHAASRPSSGIFDNTQKNNVTSDDPPEVLWDVLQQLNYSTGEVGTELADFLGKEVKIPGFIVPLEDFASEVSEFLLVPYVGACVHTPPPPPNQLVFVEMEDAEQVTAGTWEPIWVHGTLVLEETTNMYGSVGFKVAGMEIEPYVW